MSAAGQPVQIRAARELRVADALWYYAGSRRTRTVRLNLLRLDALGLGRRKNATDDLSILAPRAGTGREARTSKPHGHHRGP
jgi:hypothetical protein